MMSKGFQKKSRAEILEDMKARTRNLFGQDVNLAINSPIGIFIELFSWPLSLLWFTLEKIYNAFYIDTSTGQDLDNLAKNIGIKRTLAARAIGEIEFSGDEGTIIPLGFLIETDSDPFIQFETTEEVAIDSSGTAIAGIVAVEAGSIGNVTANTITEIVNPISGLDSTSNLESVQGGRDRETDTELRRRYKSSVSKPGGSTVDSIRAALLDMDDVRSALVIENDTMTDVDNIPPKAVESVVLGGLDDKIAETIFDSKAGGIEAYGETIVQVTDNAGYDHNVGFTRATVVNIYISLTVETDPNKFPLDGEFQIKDKIIEYIGGFDNSEALRFGTDLNENVYYSKIIKAIHDVDGVVEIKDLQIGKNDWGGISGISSEIEIGTREVAETNLEYINIGSIVRAANSYLGQVNSDSQGEITSS